MSTTETCQQPGHVLEGVSKRCMTCADENPLRATRPPRKSTMVELVQELEAVTPRTPAIEEIIAEAKAGEYHDYKNNKYDCGKVAVVGKLRAVKLDALAERVMNGEFDEEPDEDDRKMLAGLISELAPPKDALVKEAREVLSNLMMRVTGKDGKTYNQKVTFVETAEGKIDFATMTDEEAVLIYRWAQDMMLAQVARTAGPKQ